LLLAAPRRSLRDAEALLHVGALVIAIVRASLFCLFGKARG
jgi:hypothetical protein